MFPAELLNCIFPMKKLILFLFIIPIFTIDGQTSLFDQANDSYKLEKYPEAIALYDSVLSTGVTSAELYYNLGNAHYKMGKIAPCILNYERALQLSPNDKDILYNLELVQQHVVDEIDMVDQFFLKKMIKSWRVSMSSNTWAKISLSAFVICLLTLLIFFLSRISFLKKSGFFIAILSALICLVTLSFAREGKADMTSHDSAIVFVPTVTVTSSPNTNGTKIFVLHEGTKIQIVDRLDTWVEILLSDGNKGWLPANAVVGI